MLNEKWKKGWSIEKGKAHKAHSEICNGLYKQGDL